MKKNPFILFFVMLFLVPTVLAMPPFQGSELSNEIVVTVPKMEYFEYNKNFSFYVHAYNSTGHILTNATTDCYIHMYNFTGNHIIEQEMLFTNDFDFYVIINSSIIDKKGVYGVSIFCNNTAEGGFYSESILVNDRSIDLYTPDNTQGLSIVFFVLFATLIIFFLPKLYGRFSENPITEMIIVRGCYVIGFYLMVMNSGILSTIASQSGYTTGEIFRYMWLFGWGGYLLMFVTGIKTIFDIAELWRKQVNERRGFD